MSCDFLQFFEKCNVIIGGVVSCLVLCYCLQLLKTVVGVVQACHSPGVIQRCLTD